MSTDTSFMLHPQLAADTVALASLALCEVRLMNDANYPWLVLVPRVAQARELIDLDADQQAKLLHEIGACSRALQQVFAPYKLNVATLGNMVEQLHVHVIARERGDAAWPAPVWGRVPALPYIADVLTQRLARLRAALTAA